MGQSWGGVSRYFVELMTGIQRSGHSLVLPWIIHRNEFLKTSLFRENSFKLPFVHQTLVSLGSRFNSHQFEQLLESDPPDVIHETYYSKNPNIFGRIPVVTTVHDFIAEKNSRRDLPESPESERKAQSIRNASGIICVSRATLEELEHRFPETVGRAAVVPHGVSPFFLEEQDLDKEINNRPYILYVGHRTGHKNFFTLLEAFGQSSKVHSDFDLVLFGGGAISPGERATMEKYGIPAQRVLQVSGDDITLKQLYSNAVAFVFPSLYEGFGLPILEAGATGCPIVASDIPIMKEVTGEHAVFFDPLQRENLIQKLEGLLYDETALKDLGTRARKNAEKYTWDATVEKTVDLYAHVLSEDWPAK